jgi:HEAT repeat protein
MKTKWSLWISIAFVATMMFTGCDSKPNSSPVVTPSAVVEDSGLPSPSPDFYTLLDNLQSDRMSVRLVSIYALEKYGDRAEIAIPSLIDNLRVKDSDVRRASAYILGKLGRGAVDAVPELQNILIDDEENDDVRITVADALGSIGERGSVPVLVQILLDEQTQQYHRFLVINCALSISKITREKFADMGDGSYTINKDGVPLVVVDARSWWKQEGQYQDWSTP